MTRKALVIHPYLQVYAGGEVVCLHVIKALLDAGYQVRLLSDVADPEEAKRFYPEIGGVLEKVEHVRIPVEKRIVLMPGMRMIHSAFMERSIYRAIEPEDCDVCFSTQSSIFITNPKTRLIHFTYDFNDLFVFSPFTRMRDWRPDLERMKFYSETYKTGRFLTRRLVRQMFGIARPKPDLLATPSSIIIKLLEQHGYQNITTFVPPSRQYSPRPKLRQIIQVSRLVHAKRIEVFFEAARRMPEEKFILIGRRQEGAHAYGEDLLSHIPANVELIEGNLKDHAHRLQESSVYCYTGRDRAIMLTVAEAISAGCYPVVAGDSSALDVANIAKVGSSFLHMDELVHKLKTHLDNPMNPYTISKFAEPFRPEHFENWVRNVATASIIQEQEATPLMS